jgi:hypothetical protein
MRQSSCAECLTDMARVKSELLVRVACANCRQAEEDLAVTTRPLHDMSSSTFGVRCSQCGKWCWTKSALATHRRGHTTPMR